MEGEIRIKNNRTTEKHHQRVDRRNPIHVKRHGKQKRSIDWLVGGRKMKGKIKVVNNKGE